MKANYGSWNRSVPQESDFDTRFPVDGSVWRHLGVVDLLAGGGMSLVVDFEII